MSRGLQGAIVLLLLAMLGAYYAKLAMDLEIGWRQCSSDPARWDGQELVFPLWVVTGVDGPDRYRISKVVKDVPVAGPSEGLEEGDTVSVIGHFRAERMVVEQSVIEVHHLRPYKEAIGAIGLLAAIFGLPWLFRWRERRLEERFGG